MTGKTPHKIRILVVDDEEIITFTLAAFLEDRGYHVLTANNGDTALNIIKKEPRDMAIVDIRLKEYDGNAFILKAHEIQQGLKFIIHTGSINYSIPPEIANLGITNEDIFIKPIRDFNALFEIIERKCKKTGEMNDHDE
ncbi:MAG: response regulator [Acidobacteria bacterium]|jgi:DNA-binding NtrC family response regulator|nr:response regulator [Acidobacteriota bacterium]